MKAITTMIMLAILITTGISYGQETCKSKGKPILISIRLYSEVEGKSFTMAPKVLTMEKTLATVTIGNKKEEPGSKEVKDDKEAHDLFVRIEVTPSVVENVTPPLIKMDIKFSLTHNGYKIEQSFNTVVKDGESFNIESADKSKNQKLAMKISASITDKIPDKPQSSVEAHREISSDRLPEIVDIPERVIKE